MQSWGDRVRLQAQPAHVTDGLPKGHFDTIVINSVVQYFPNAGYLAEVIDKAVELLAPGGSLFIGDVRNHSLQGAFQTGIALARAGTSDADDIRQRVQHAMLGEPELLLAPEFFTTWVAEHPSVAGVDIQVKRGEADNELTRYRYDVTIHKSPAAVSSLADAPDLGVGRVRGAERTARRVGGPTSRCRARHRDSAYRRIADVAVEQALADGLPLADALVHAGACHRHGHARTTAPPRRGQRISGRGHLGRSAPARWTPSSSTPADDGLGSALIDLYRPTHAAAAAQHLRQRSRHQQQAQRGAAMVGRCGCPSTWCRPSWSCSTSSR